MANKIYAVWDSDSNRFSFNVRGKEEVEVSREYFSALLAGQATGKVIGRNEQGDPVLVESMVLPNSNTERAWRNARIEQIRWLGERHREEVELGSETSLGSAEYKALLQYLQALRDWPVAAGFPSIEHRPGAPAWLDQQLSRPMAV